MVLRLKPELQQPVAGFQDVLQEVITTMFQHNRGEANRATPETLIFLHVPKTGGISVSQAIVRQFREDEIFHVRNGAHEKSPVFAKAHGSIDQFKRLPEARRRRFRCILGHMHFGVHEHVPGRSAYVTLLRNPLERLLSQYGQYCRMVRNRELAEAATVPSLEEFCRAKSRAMDNHQTRFLCGWKFDDHPRQQSLNRAKENLARRFRVVGTLERFNETMQILHRAYGWPDVTLFQSNVGSGRLHREDVDPDFLARLEELNWLDRELHATANSLLDAAIGEYGRSSSAPARAAQAPRKPFFLRRSIGRLLERLRNRG